MPKHNSQTALTSVLRPNAADEASLNKQITIILVVSKLLLPVTVKEKRIEHN
jgi:hypothetical protein